ncbi:Ubiquitin-like modifier-activating enzyme ATG7 [Vanrija pseudolonga]|uniref:Probable 26S proteasome regulatory subunit rpn-6.2 n=1 Tax=Vanrija pseudolonga TaxID=143232 RepID=A0AAF1BJ06_9TREE|nr:Ubiquitin-like modifier-activating enzyme ATG7 [Vanrija pseudolonga]
MTVDTKEIDMEADLNKAESLRQSAPEQAEALYRSVLSRKAVDEDELKDQETALLKLGALFRDTNKPESLAQLVVESRQFMSQIAKAKTAKLIRALIDFFPPSARDLQMKVTGENIEWARKEKRVFLRQSLEIKLVALHIDAQNYRKALSMTEDLLKELKQLDDKIILTEVFLLESRAAHAIQNLPRAKAALTSARTTANSIYCPPLLQAQLDLQAGALNADDKDYKTAYSYFFEAFEGFTQVDESDPRSLSSLKYMLLCKIMMGLPEDVTSLLLMKSASRYAGKDLDAMKATAQAQKERSLELFKATLKKYQDQLQKDNLIRSHLAALYDTLLEQNLLRVIEPYSSVELSWISHEVGQGRDVVELKLSQMILDQVFFGVLNEKAGTLEVFDEPQGEGLLSGALETMKQMGSVIQALYEKYHSWLTFGPAKAESVGIPTSTNIARSMAPLQFQPLASQPTPEFWSSLTSLKLDKLRLDDSEIPIHAWLDEGRQIVNANRLTGKVSGDDVAVDGSVLLDESAFTQTSTRPSPSATLLRGVFKNYNTIEDFRSPQKKKELFDNTVTSILQSFETDEPQLDGFVLVAFADLKKYTYHYWFAFPVLVSKPAWQVEGSFDLLSDDDTRQFRRGIGSSSVVIAKGPPGHREFTTVSRAKEFFGDADDEERFVIFRDSSAQSEHPGWYLRNVLYYLQAHQGVTRVNVVCLRQGPASRVGKLFTETFMAPNIRPQAVGWERDATGRLASRVANLGPMMDPTRLAEQAVDLNLKLMRWRILPSLDLEKVASTKCLLLGAGTLGCYVARVLMGWGVRNITFVDSARVSYSNPVRQPLFQFEDCLEGGKPKAQCAADRLRQIFPAINATAHEFMIPMPGHPVAADGDEATAANVAKLTQLVDEHDAIFLLMDSRESRWLPTLLAASSGKIVVNAALGFDSYLVMRHGTSPLGQASQRLGCYFCNDIVAPTDSLTDRTLDQMCTVTRPGIAPIAAAAAVELLVSTVQHPLGVSAPAERSSSDGRVTASPLGPVPHQIRGMLSQWNTVLVEGSAYDRCTACSATVVKAYQEQGFSFLRRAFNETGFLESVTGLDKLYAESEAILDSVDWEEDSDEGL